MFPRKSLGLTVINIQINIQKKEVLLFIEILEFLLKWKPEIQITFQLLETYRGQHFIICDKKVI